jgi:hypothetical protein
MILKVVPAVFTRVAASVVTKETPEAGWIKPVEVSRTTAPIARKRLKSLTFDIVLFSLTFKVVFHIKLPNFGVTLQITKLRCDITNYQTSV